MNVKVVGTATGLLRVTGKVIVFSSVAEASATVITKVSSLSLIVPIPVSVEFPTGPVEEAIDKSKVSVPSIIISSTVLIVNVDVIVLAGIVIVRVPGGVQSALEVV